MRVVVTVTEICQFFYPISPKEKRKLIRGVTEEARCDNIARAHFMHVEKPRTYEVEVLENVFLRGRPDYVDLTIPAVIEKKAYPVFNRRLYERLRLQLSLYALILSIAHGLDYEEIQAFAYDHENRLRRIQLLPRDEVLRRVETYVRSRVLMRSLFS